VSYDERYKNYHFVGALAEPMNKYVNERRSLGRLFNKQSQMLSRLNKLSLAFNLERPELTRDLVETWIELKPNECRKNQRQRLNFVKLFGNFMLRNGYVAYLPSVTISTLDDNQFVPYIFTKEELTGFFYQIDHMKQSVNNPRAIYIFPVLYRILYCCGLRVNEALNLLICDVDIQTGVLRIREAKHGKHRYVPMSPAMTARCKKLLLQIHADSGPESWFFPNARNNAMRDRQAYQKFREFLQLADISHGGKGNGPRLHDLRHTFAVHCLQKWVSGGVDLNAALPYLSSYLGHYKLGGTQKYLHLTTEAHAGLAVQFQEYIGDIIPVLEAPNEE
jgi:integrase